MKRAFRFTLVLVVLLCSSIFAQEYRVRQDISIPDIPGYIALIADLHTHTVLSDGMVHPAIRPEEAWREGIDVLAITDHIEYQPHREWIPTNHNLPHELASGRARELSVLLIRGSEITRGMPLGHYNAIFLTDNEAIEHDDPMKSFEAAAAQGAFIFWNHPGWPREDRIPVWEKEQQELYDRGFMHGIEVVNTREYYPLAHKWALEKGITMIGNSDVHNPAGLDYDHRHGDHRSLTLIFATEKSHEAIHEALKSRRTAVWHEHLLLGEEKYLKPLFENSIEMVTPTLEISGNGGAQLQIRNNSDIDFKLKRIGEPEGYASTESVTLKARHTSLIWVGRLEGYETGEHTLMLPYEITNLYVLPETGMQIEIPVTVKLTN